jgi:hypothetical protein
VRLWLGRCCRGGRKQKEYRSISMFSGAAAGAISGASGPKDALACIALTDPIFDNEVRYAVKFPGVVCNQC